MKIEYKLVSAKDLYGFNKQLGELNEDGNWRPAGNLIVTLVGGITQRFDPTKTWDVIVYSQLFTRGGAR